MMYQTQREDILVDYMPKGINSSITLKEYETVTLEYTNQIQKEVFKEDNMVVSICKRKTIKTNT